ncbi:CHAT domain-containing protein [Colletotrichum lupini]|nr:CHAT domain-containing protein [Colletotrichum lupini]
MENITEIVEAIRQPAEVLSQHPDDLGVKQALAKAINAATRALEQLTSVSTGSPQDINLIIEWSEQVLSVVPEKHAFRATLLGDLSHAYYQRFSMTGSDGNVNDLNRAVQLAEEDVPATRPETEQRMLALANLNQMLQNRYDYTRDKQDINRAISVGEDAAERIPKDSRYTALVLRRLAISRGKLFELTHNLNDAERALNTAEAAVKTAKSQGDVPGVAIGSNTLARILGRRFEQTANIEDLDRAVDVLTATVPLIPKSQIDYVVGTSYLATLLGIRYEQQGDVDDLSASISYTKSVLQLISNDDTERPVQLFNLANRLVERAQYTGVLSDLDDAVDCGRQALRLVRANHPERTNWLRGLSQFLGIRFSMGSKHPQDIQQAIDLSREAAQVVDGDDMGMRAAVANVLSNLLKEKHDHYGEAADLDEAINIIREVIHGGLPECLPERVYLEFGLGDALHARFDHTGDVTDLQNSREAFQRAWESRAAPLTIRIDAAVRAADVAKEQLETHDSSDPSLLHALSPRHMQNVNKQQMLKRFAGLGANAAAAALNAGKEASYALQQLELGRGVISDDLSRLRSMLDSGHSALSTTGSLESGSQARRRAEMDLENLLTKIRSEKGFERFLMPPTVEQLMEAADPDTAVVVNVSSFRCDAFIVEKQRIKLMKLPLLSLDDIQAYAKGLKGRPDSLSSVLEWLWSSAVYPVLNALGFDRPLPLDEDSWPHIWWIPVGPLNSLPLHAAGYHNKHSGETALDCVMSSYSSSLKSLLAGRRQKISQNDSGPINALLVSMKSTPYRSPLRYAELEVAMLEKLCPALNATPIRPVQDKANVLEQLGTCDIFHFAGHGTSNSSDPSQSALLLRDWEKSPLTVEDLRNEKLQEKPPFLAYLSACSTGANEVLGLVDEGIHLGYACQLAGFRHVVGTLWTVSDPFCVNVARKFYETIRNEGKTDAAVHRGLHLALRELRDVQVGATTRGFSNSAINAVIPDDEGEGMAIPGRENVDSNGDGNDGGRTAQSSGSRKGDGVDDEEPSMNSLWVPFVHFGV